MSPYLLGQVTLLSNSPAEEPGLSLLSEIKKPGRQVITCASKISPSLCKRQLTFLKYELSLIQRRSAGRGFTQEKTLFILGTVVVSTI